MDIISLRLSGGRSMAFAVVRSGSSRIPVLICAVNDRERPDFKSIPHFGYWDTGPGSSDHLRWTTIVRSAPYYPTVVALDLSALAAAPVHRVGELRFLRGRSFRFLAKAISSLDAPSGRGKGKIEVGRPARARSPPMTLHRTARASVPRHAPYVSVRITSRGRCAKHTRLSIQLRMWGCSSVS